EANARSFLRQFCAAPKLAVIHPLPTEARDLVHTVLEIPPFKLPQAFAPDSHNYYEQRSADDDCARLLHADSSFTLFSWPHRFRLRPRLSCSQCSEGSPMT